MNETNSSAEAHSLLLLSVGPVQDLIASARRCRDLWFGSWLLAEAAKAAAIHIAEDASARGVGAGGVDALVFPGAHSRAMLDADQGVANRILARLDASVDTAATVANGAADAARARLAGLADEAFGRIGRSALARYFHRETAVAQIADLLDIQWVAIAERPGEYDAARQRADAMLAARKNTRDWEPSSWSAPVPKSSIDGVRESVLDDALFDAIGRGELSPQDVYATFRAHPSERLCGVGLLKRLGTPTTTSDDPDRFLSTSHLAALPSMMGAAGHAEAPTAAARLRAELTSALPGIQRVALDVVPRTLEPFGRMDGAVFFDARVAELAEEAGHVALGTSSASVLQAQSAVRAFRDAVNMREPLPYFAILVADGDHMGRTIASITRFEEHRRLSRALAEFASTARRIVEDDHHGSLVYSGGDDVLALMPLHTAIACADALRTAFQDALQTVDGFEVAPPTLSVGVAVGHHLTPLDATLAQARDAERMAKVKRNSLAIIVDKRSGSDIALSGSWDEPCNLAERLELFANAHRADLISDGTAYELAELERLTAGPGDTPEAAMGQVVAAEVERLLARKRSAQGEPIDAGLVRSLRALGLLEQPARLGMELIAARLFADAAERAGSPLAPPATENGAAS